jgi:transcriptional regulator with XRE-family HTH domain
MSQPSTIFAKRLQAARKAKSLTQEQLGVLTGMDELSASARMNQYERGKHWPHYSTVEKLAQVLGVPAAYFYAATESEAELLALFHQLDLEAQVRFMESLRLAVSEKRDSKA